MRLGGSKSKGTTFERKICVDLSRWITGGARDDVFWRSATSGGRATVAHKKGKTNRQAGDITAVAPEGNKFTEHFFIECKHLKNLKLGEFFIKGNGFLADFWLKARAEARAHRRSPLLIARQNKYPIIVVCKTLTLVEPVWQSSDGHPLGRCCIFMYDDLLTSDPKPWDS